MALSHHNVWFELDGNNDDFDSGGDEGGIIILVASKCHELHFHRFHSWN